jgi:5'-nucleotidase/UDP-sugar diphosphatase
VRAAGADFVIGLLHVGEIDPTLNTPMIAERVKGLDVIIDGHSHTKHPNGLVHNGILIAQAGQFGENIGIVDLKFEKGGIVGVEASLRERASFEDAPEKSVG